MKNVCFILLVVLVGCNSEQDAIQPVVKTITESVYASGILVSKNQYNVYSTVSGIADEVLVTEGEEVTVGTPILSVANAAQELTQQNAKLSSDFNALSLNKGKLQEAELFVDLAKSKMESDGVMLERQKKLWEQTIGTKLDLEQKELAFKNATTNYESAKEKLEELSRQLNFLSKQAQNNLEISNHNVNDYLIKSKLSGKVYQLMIEKGEIVTPQIALAIIGDSKDYHLEMQVDEYDIVKIKKGMKVLVVLNSYKDSVFAAEVTNIEPIMNVKSKTFTIKAEFSQRPPVLYPNISFEANILIKTKNNALLIPRNYLLNDSIVVTKKGDRKVVKTGLKDYQMVEIISGITRNEELILPVDEN